MKTWAWVVLASALAVGGCAQENAPHLAVVGIGINVNQSLEDFPPELQSRAISLAMALERPVDRRHSDQQRYRRCSRRTRRTQRRHFRLGPPLLLWPPRIHRNRKPKHPRRPRPLLGLLIAPYQFVIRHEPRLRVRAHHVWPGPLGAAHPAVRPKPPLSWA